jgi:hypothetical protein
VKADAHRASRAEQIGQLRVAVLRHELRHALAPAPAARLANNRQRRLTKVGQDKRAVAGAARERLAKRKRGESVAGGLSKKLDIVAMTKAAGFTPSQIGRMVRYASLPREDRDLVEASPRR